MQFTQALIDQIDKEFQRWHDFLNYTLGFFSFNAGLTCMGLKQPSVYAFISLVFFYIAALLGRKRFPPTFADLRSKKNKTAEEEIWYLGLNSKHLGVWAFFRNFSLFIFGTLFLGGIGILSALDRI